MKSERTCYVDVGGGAVLFVREVGRGTPIVVAHGGPDFDHTYLLPDLDALADAYRLVYYDQRCRGRSRGALRLEEIHIDRYVEDLERVRAGLRLERIAVLGHSWGGFLAMHYALRHGERLSHLILLNTAPASFDDMRLTGAERERQLLPDRAKLEALESSAAFGAGDPVAVNEFYRTLFASSLERREDARKLSFGETAEEILRGRAIEGRLMETGLVWREGYTILPDLAGLRVPTLVLHGENDFVPVAAARRIAAAIPGAKLEVIPRAGHFAFIDAPKEVHAALDRFFGRE